MQTPFFIYFCSKCPFVIQYLMVTELIDHLSGFVKQRRLEKFDRVLEYRTRYIKLICEDIYQGHNASALLRTCDCFGVQDIHIVEGRNRFEVNPEVSLGASNWLSIYRHTMLQKDHIKVFGELKSQGYRIVATVPCKQAIKLSEFNLDKGPVALLFGTEKEGLTPSVINEADEFLTIDMCGFTESFNVSVSAGIILHHLRLKLMESDIEWQLNENEKLFIKLEWLRKSVKRSDLIEKEFTARICDRPDN